MNFVSEIKPVFNISYHSYSEIVIYPYGCKPLQTPTGEAVTEIGAELGKKLDYRPGTAWDLLYNVDGGDIDWMYVQQQVIPYVIEVNSTMQGFHPRYDKWRDKTVLLNRAGWMHLLDRLNGPSLQGRVNLNEYQTVKIYKAGDSLPIQEYKINPDGTYYIIMKQGSYDFSFEGSLSKKFQNITVSSKQNLSF